MCKSMRWASLVCVYIALAGCATAMPHGASSSNCGNLVEENQQQREILSKAQKLLEQDKVTYLRLEQHLKSSTNEIERLRKDLLFYRSIISPPDGKDGLRIHDLNIESAGSDNTYNYKILLVQSIKHEKTIYGTVTLHISGYQDGKEATVIIPAANSPPISIMLRYFQEINGKFVLPRGFQPRSINARTISRDGSQSDEKVFEWSRV
jgi:hypothetical protein